MNFIVYNLRNILRNNFFTVYSKGGQNKKSKVGFLYSKGLKFNEESLIGSDPDSQR